MATNITTKVVLCFVAYSNTSTYIKKITFKTQLQCFLIYLITCSNTTGDKYTKWHGNTQRI